MFAFNTSTGIFGCPAGRHILQLLKNLRMPVVTTLHTVQKNMSPPQAKVLRELLELSDSLVVMAEKAREFLIDRDNDLHVSLYNPRTGGCGDCLVPDGVNRNEGAESTLSWLLSLTTLHKLAAENRIVVNHYQKK